MYRKTFALFLLAILSAACATSRPARLVVIQTAGDGDAASIAGPRVHTSAKVLEPEEVRRRVPLELLVPDHARGAEILASLMEQERRFFEEDPDKAGEILLGLWPEMMAHPEYLPSAPEERRRVYSALLLVYRLSPSGEPRSAVAVWLATHMQDQEPTVRLLPPEFEAEASKALEDVRSQSASVRARSVGGDVTGCEWMMDGVSVGAAPFAGLKVPRGIHVFVPRCGGVEGWARKVTVENDELVLVARDMKVESAISWNSGIPWLSPFGVDNYPHLGTAMVSSLGVDGVLLVPRSDEEPALLATRFGVREIRASPEGLVVEESHLRRRVPWRRHAALVLLTLGVVTAGSGGGVQFAYEEAVADVNAGRQDRRDELPALRDAATGLYIGAGVFLAAAGTLFFLDVLDKPTAVRSAFPLVEFEN